LEKGDKREEEYFTTNRRNFGKEIHAKAQKFEEEEY